MRRWSPWRLGPVLSGSPPPGAPPPGWAGETVERRAVRQLEVRDRRADHGVHVPELRTAFLSHAHAVSGVPGVAVEVDGIALEEVDLLFLVVLVPAAGEDHALL